jgi:hypothetical protein
VFIDILDNSHDSHNKLWVRAELDQDFEKYQNAYYMNWVGYIKLDDMSLKTDSSIIQFPTHENFPINMYTVSKIANELGSALYVIGGNNYSKKDSKYIAKNSFFKYNFTTKEWVDMSYLANGRIKRINGHKSVVIDNRCIVILQHYMVNSAYGEQNLNNSMYSSRYFSLYNLAVFDTYTSSWDIVNIKPDIHDTTMATFGFNSFSATVYKNKIIFFGGTISESGSNSGYGHSKLGILDYSSKTWI